MNQFRSTKTIGRVTEVLFLVGIVINALKWILLLVQRSVNTESLTNQQEFTGPEIVLSLAFVFVNLGFILVIVLTVVSFLIWMHRSYNNLLAFDVQSLGTTPGWAVAYWFIPILSLFKPLRAMNELYHGSDPTVGDAEMRVANDSTTSFHGFWWALWLIGNIGSNISIRISLRANSPESFAFAEMVDLFLIPLWMVCGWLAYQVVKEITDRQELVGAQIGMTGPPEPPIFGSEANAVV